MVPVQKGKTKNPAREENVEDHGFMLHACHTNGTMEHRSIANMMLNITMTITPRGWLSSVPMGCFLKFGSVLVDI
jgi:hypothetical protein